MTKEAKEQRICAIVDRHKGTPYTDTLKMYRLSPREFAMSVFRSLDRLIEEPMVQGDRGFRAPLEEVRGDDKVKIDLFEMERQFLIEQYDRIWKHELHLRKEYDKKKIPRSRTREETFKDGTHIHPNNKRFLIPYILEFHHSTLGHPTRKYVVEEMNNLLVKPKEYFHGLKLKGLMIRALDKGHTDSVRELLRVYDLAYQVNRQQPSLFNHYEDHYCCWSTRGVVTARNGHKKS